MRFRFALLMLPGLLSGCASNCNILSDNNSFVCDAVLVGGAILAAPLILPIQAAKQSAHDAEERKDYLKLKEGVKKGDLESLKRCVLQCKNFLVFREEKHQIRQEAARKLITMDEPALPQAHVEAMMMAYESLAWVKTTDAGWHLNSDYVLRGWALAQRFLEGPHESSSYKDVPRELAQSIFSIHLKSLPEEQIQSAFEGCVAQDNLPKHPQQHRRPEICERAYISYFSKQNPANRNPQVPKELESRWVEDSRALARARRDAASP